MNIKRIITIMLLISVSACSNMNTPAPEVSLIDIRFDNMSLMETNLNTKVRFENEANEAINTTGSVHELTLNGIYIGKAMSDKALTIPRLGSATQDVTFRLSNFSLLTKIQRLMETQDFKYEIKSKLYTGTGFTSGTLVKKNSGEINLGSLNTQ